MELLGQDELARILSSGQLKTRDLGRAARVCKSLAAAVALPEIWERTCRRAGSCPAAGGFALDSNTEFCDQTHGGPHRRQQPNWRGLLRTVSERERWVCTGATVRGTAQAAERCLWTAGGHSMRQSARHSM